MAKSRPLILTEYLLFRLVVLPLHLLPRPAWRLAGRILAAIGWAFVASARKTVFINLDLAFGQTIPAGTKRRIARRSYDELGMTAVEMVNWHRLSGKDVIALTDSTTVHRIKDSLAKGRGLVGCCAHYSNWEWIAGYVAALGYPVNAVIRPLDNPLLDRHLSAARLSKNVRILARRTSIRPGLDALKRNEILALMVDQNAAVGGAMVPFFGVEASSMRGPAYFAEACGSPVRFFHEHRKPDGRHVVWVSEELPMGRGELEDLKTVHARVEELVRRDPAPWMWVHPRWRKRPAGESGFYPGIWT